MNPQDDPLAESVYRGPCVRCDGVGWMPVAEAYVLGLNPDLEPLPADAPAEVIAAYEKASQHLAERRAATRQSMYPCRSCNSDVFYRWVSDHYATTHDRDRCDECHNPKRRAA